MEQPRPLSRLQEARALRSFITASGLWGAWGQATGLGTAVFTGYALLLGGDESFIALCTAAAYLIGITQVIFPLLGPKLGDKKRFVVAFGTFEILLRGSIVLVPLFLAPSLYLGSLLGLISLGLLCGYAISPFHNTWVASTVPAHSRGRFTSRQTITSTFVAMVAGFGIGQFIDMFGTNDRQMAFSWVFAVGTLFGLAGFLVLRRAPYPAMPPTQGQAYDFTRVLRPFADSNFRRAALFYGTWTFAVGIAGSLYSVFMLKRLNISYTEISIFNALFMVVSIVGYRMWAVLVDRFGGKSVLRLLLLPSAVIPLVWIANEPGAYYLVPVALTLSGIILSGIAVSVTPLQYGLLPEGDEKPFYLAAWNASSSLLGALGPLCGAVLVRYLEPVQIVVGNLTIGNLQIVFAISAALRLVPALLLRGVEDAKEISSRRLLANMFGGNLLSYAYNAALFSLVSTAGRRAQATLAMGRSGHPLAIQQLIQALADASPKVRSNAARALGETGSDEATEPLIRELLDDSSDIRSEAAEALGALGHPAAVDPLIEALDDPDAHVRTSAVHGLAGSRGEEAQELLFWYFSEDFDPQTFPTLVEILGGMGDRRIVKPALNRMQEFHSNAIRLQLLNGVCHAFGAGDQFYRLISQGNAELPSRLSRLLKRAASTLTTSPGLTPAVRNDLRLYSRQLVTAHEQENSEFVEESVRQLAATLRDGLAPTTDAPYEVLSIYVIIVAINDYLQSPVRQELGDARDIFPIVCVNRLAVLVRALKT